MGKDIEVIRDKNAMRRWSREKRKEGETLCLVPTMGYLHRGHLTLVEEAKKRAQRVIVSVYVNPSQFAVGEDFGSYPSNFEGDLVKLRALGVDAVFNPHDLYVRGDGNAFREEGNETRRTLSCLEEGSANGHETWIRVERLEKPLCGVSRPVFFRGVATVVAKLFHIVEPDMAVFGKKDYQQWRLICHMVRDLDFAVEVIGSEIARDPDGLALSSRNVHLSPEERQKALSISKSLKEVREAVCNGEVSTKKLEHSVVETILKAGGKVDYAEVVDQVTLRHLDKIQPSAVLCVAAWFGGVRLIDNIELQVPAQ